MTRLRVEPLEAREVPASFSWIGSLTDADPNTDTNANNLYNWQQDWYPATRLPGPGDDVGFTPGSGDCDGFAGPAGGSFRYMIVPELYDGTITLAGGLTTHMLSLRGATSMAIAQPLLSIPYSPATITVTGYTDPTYGYIRGAFEWLRGTINGTTNLGLVRLIGTDALIKPVDLLYPGDPNGPPISVNLGSSIELDNGSIATMREGTINVTNGGWEFNVNTSSELEIDPGTGSTTTISTVADGQINLTSGTAVHVNEGTFTTTAGIKNTGGNFTLRQDTTANVSGEVDQVAGGPTYLQNNGGGTYLSSGSALYLIDSPMRMDGGTLVTESGLDPALIVGNVTIAGGDVMVDSTATGDTHEFGTLKVLGGVTWNGGTWWPWVSTEGTSSDVWDINGPLTIGGTATLRPRGVDGEGNPATPAAGMQWLLFQTGGITNAAGTPTVHGPWAIVPVPGNPVTR